MIFFRSELKVEFTGRNQIAKHLAPISLSQFWLLHPLPKLNFYFPIFGHFLHRDAAVCAAVHFKPG